MYVKDFTKFADRIITKKRIEKTSGCNFMSGLSVNTCNFSYIVAKTDYEWLQIINKLRRYGISSSKNKLQDIALLHELELREARSGNDCTDKKFSTLNQSELAAISEENKKNYAENNSKDILDAQNASKILGEQLYLAVKLKNMNET